MRPLVVALVVALVGTVRAEPVRLRMSTLAPEGTSWAREIKAFSRDVEAATRGQALLKWYFGGIAGDDVTVLGRIRRNQLDGGGGTLICEQLAPSLRVTRVAGLFQSREEAQRIYARLRQRIDQEMSANGFIDLALGSFGSIIVFSRTPVHSLAELRATRLWSWDQDTLWGRIQRDLGLSSVPLSVDSAGRAYEEKRVDGFLSMPAAALAFQWSTQARYYTDLKLATLPACVVIAQRAFDALSVENQRAIRTAAAKLAARFEDVGQAQDEALLGGLLARQGLTPVPVSDAFRLEFLEAARVTRGRLEPETVSAELMSQVLSWLADYRGELSAGRKR